MSNETKEEKIARLKHTIKRAEFQMADKSNSEEIRQIFRDGKAEAERQLKELQTEAPAEKSLSESAESRLLSDKKPLNENQKTEKPLNEVPESRLGSEEKPLNKRLFEKKEPSSTQTVNTGNESVIFAGKLSGTTVVRIEYAGSRPAEVLKQGECLNRLHRMLKDCAESKAATSGNWGKLTESATFNNLVTYYRAYAHFPRPSGAEFPTTKDIGEQKLISSERAETWNLLTEIVCNRNDR